MLSIGKFHIYEAHLLEAKYLIQQLLFMCRIWIQILHAIVSFFHHFNFFELSPLKCNINNVWRTVISANCVFFNSYLFWLFKLSILILGEGDLHDLVRKTMYAGVINNLFGDNTLPVDDAKVTPNLPMVVHNATIKSLKVWILKSETVVFLLSAST